MKATVKDTKTATKKEAEQTTCSKACDTKHDGHKKKSVKTAEKEKKCSI